MLTEKRERRRRAALRAGRDPSRARPDGRAAEAPLGGRSARSRSSAAAAGRRRPCSASRALPSASRCRSTTSFRRQMLFPADHPAYAGDLGIGPNPKLLARIKEADLVLLVGGRMSEMPSQSYTLFDIPTPRQTLVHVHPDAERARPRLPPASRDQRLADRFLGGARGRAAAARDRLGRGDRARRMRTILAWTDPPPSIRPGRFQMGEVDGASAPDAAGRHDHLQRRRQLRGLGAPLLALPRLRHAARARPPARWATACRPPSARSGCIPDRTVVCLRRRRRLPDERPGIRDRGAVRAADRRRSCSTTACTAPSACTRSANIPAASRRRR